MRSILLLLSIFFLSENAFSVGRGVSPRNNAQIVSYDASVQSAAFGSGQSLLRAVCTTACYLVFGANPTATTTGGIFLPANTPDFFGITAGQKVAVIKAAGASAGVLSLSEGEGQR